MKAVIKRVTVFILCMLCVCFIGLVAEAYENAALESRPNAYKQSHEVSGLYQYGQFMSEDEIQACMSALEDTEIIEYIYNNMLRREEEIFLDEFREPMYPEDLEVYFKAILNTYPEFYFVSMRYYYYIYDDGTLASLVPIYIMEESDIAQTQALIDAEVEKICSVVKEGMSDFDKITAVHDYFAEHYSYDYKNLRDIEYMRKHTMPALLLDKTAVCQGYGLSFMYVMRKLGIECITVQSDAMNHLWNLVQLENGNWYHVDVTWDDPSQDWYDPSNKPTLSDEEYEFAVGKVRTYFMLSDNKIKSLESPHHSYTPDGMAMDDTYAEVGVFDVNTSIVWEAGGWYYVDTAGKLHKYTAINDSDTVVLEIEGGWPYIDASFAYVCEYNGNFYYNTAKDIMKYDPRTGTSTVVVASPDGVGGKSLIYKMTISGSSLTYTVATDYLGTGSQEKTIDLAKLSGVDETPGPNIVMEVTAGTEGGNTTVNISGDIAGVVCAVDYEGGKLNNIKILDAAENITFEGIEADEIYVWDSMSSMKPLCDAYVINK